MFCFSFTLFYYLCDINQNLRFMKEQEYKDTQVTEHIKLRIRKGKKGDSLYLDIYDKGKRRREFLGLYIVTGGGKQQAMRNTRTWREAVAKAEAREVDLADGWGDGKKELGKRIRLTDWLEQREKEQREKATDEGRDRQGTGRLMHTAAGHVGNFLKKTHRDGMLLGDVDNTFMREFGSYLCTLTSAETNRPLALNSKRNMFGLVSASLREAQKRGIIANAPTVSRAEAIPGKTEEAKRDFLTEEEIVKMAKTDCKSETVKKAFLFSCFTGLRWSDIETLKWGDITEENGSLKLRKKMVKTQREVEVYVNTTAANMLPPRGSDKDKVWALPATISSQRYVKAWAEAAGVKKHVTPHVARHSFATLNLTRGNDVYTVSRLLGHMHVRTTEIYVKVIDEKRREAADRIAMDLNF